MLETYADFMIFEVEDNGERRRLHITEEFFHQNNGERILHSSQVAIIVKEEIRRIYIWKGISSSVRKKFIASRVASTLQKELMNSSSFHRCKIVSIDQGDEPNEFLNTFGFQKRAIIIEADTPITPKLPNNESISYNMGIWSRKMSIKSKENIVYSTNTNKSPSYEKLKNSRKTQELLENILKSNTPDNFTPRNILIGNNILYSETIKKTEILNNQLEEKGWEAITSFPKDIFEIEGAKLRIYVNKEIGEIEAIEVLEKTQSSENPIENTMNNDYKTWTVKQLKQFCRENDIKVPSSYRKADIVRLVVENCTPS
ncbi:MAG: hypothetical protein ACW972_04575 [Promethearchaeota archaeon]|jgi:hypothetical protein